MAAIRDESSPRSFGRTAETRLVAPIGNSHYDSLQTSLERRFAAGYQLGISYTWSKSIGICCSDNSDGLAAIQIPEYHNLNRSVTPSDSPHNLTMNGMSGVALRRGPKWASRAPSPGSWEAGRSTAS